MPLKQILLTVFLLINPPVWGEIKTNGKYLDADFTDMTLEAALSEIADYTGVRVYTSHPLDAKIIVGFKKISLENLLSHLLLGYNVSYLKDEQNNLEEIRIFAVGSAPKTIAQPQVTASSDQAEKENGRFYVTAHLNDIPVRLLVDTGASQLSLSGELAAKLGILPLTNNVLVETAGGMASAYPAVVEHFSMAGKTLENVQAIVLPQLKEDGLLGQNILAHYRHIAEGDSMRFEPMEATTPISKEKPLEKQSLKSIPIRPTPRTQ